MPDTKQAAMAYVGVKPCGCAVAITVDAPPSTLVRRDVSEFIRTGLAVERMTVDAGVARIRERKECCRQARMRQGALPLVFGTAG